MSAPNQGRQSPEPERQGHKQTNAPADAKVGASSHAEASQKESGNTLNNLESNPKGVLDDAAEAKTAKGHQAA